MKTEQEYIKDLSEIRLMMERSTKFLSLSGLSGILAGIYALAGAYLAHLLFFSNTELAEQDSLTMKEFAVDTWSILLLAAIILLLAVGTAAILSSKKAKRNNEVVWNSVSRRLVTQMSIPLVSGGLLILALLFKGALILVPALTLIFYGLSLVSASRFTFSELRSLGMTQIILGLLSSYFLSYALLLWAVGFGLMHIAYGIYMHLKYER